MATELPRKALIAVPGKHFPFYGDGKSTGLFYTEALHPYSVFRSAGFEVDLVSESGSYGVDDHSTDKEFLTGEDREIYDDPTSEFNLKLNKQLKKASDVDPKEYGLFFAAAGHAAIYDYPSAKDLHRLAKNIWDRGGVVSAVCHGPAILPGVLDGSSGRSIVSGKKMTGFTTKGEIELKIIDRIKADGAPLIEDSAKAAGAIYVSPAHPFDDFSVVSGRVVTGANPASAHTTDENAMKAFAAL